MSIRANVVLPSPLRPTRAIFCPDLCYHVMVLMVQMGISVEDITRELEKRHVVDKKVKQERMQ